MAQKTDVYLDLHPDWIAEISRTWGWVMVIGSLFVILGIIGFAATVLATEPDALFFGVLLMGGALFHLIQMFRMTSWAGSAIQATITILYLIAGGFIIAQRDALIGPLSLIVGLALFGIGIMRIIASQRIRALPGWKWVMSNGIVDLVFGALLLLGLAMTAPWVSGLFISLELLVSGIAYIAVAVRLRRRIPIQT